MMYFGGEEGGWRKKKLKYWWDPVQRGGKIKGRGQEGIERWGKEDKREDSDKIPSWWSCMWFKANREYFNRFFDTFLNMDLGNSHSASFFYNLSARCVSSVVLIPVNQSRTESSVCGRLQVGAPLKISLVITMCNFARCSRQLWVPTVLQQCCYFKFWKIVLFHV